MLGTVVSFKILQKTRFNFIRITYIIYMHVRIRISLVNDFEISKFTNFHSRGEVECNFPSILVNHRDV